MEQPPGEDRQPQLPSPSLWPVGFAVGIVCLLVGLVVSWWVAALGAALALVFGFLWAREVASGRPSDDHAPDTAAMPARAGDAAMAEPAGERFPRNKFLEGATLGLGAAIGAIVTLPALGFALMPAFVDQGEPEVDIGPIENFPENKFIVATFLRDPKQGEISRHSAFIRNNGSVAGKPSFTTISNRCAHLGCPVQAGGPLFDDQKKTFGHVTLIPALPAAGFICPCHGGSYDQEGNRIAGPPVRALDRYEFFIRNGHIFLGDVYSVAKVDGAGATARIYKYEKTGPGQHVDGPEAWLYPLQPPH